MGIRKGPPGQAKGPIGTNVQPVGALKASKRNSALHENLYHPFAHFVQHLGNSRAFSGYATGKKEQLIKQQMGIVT